MYLSHNWFVRGVCVALVLLMPVTLLGADFKTAMLYGKGNVTVNGKGAAGSSALYAGDSVRTLAGSSATITGSGTAVTLDENSGLSFAADKIEVSQGHAVVSAPKGIVIRFAGVNVGPASATAKFAVLRAKGRCEIAALTGPLVISDGKHTELLAAGNVAVKAEEQASQEPAPPEPKGKRKGAFAIPGWELAVLAGGVGAAGYGIHRALSDDHPAHQSPTSPRWQQ